MRRPTTAREHRSHHEAPAILNKVLLPVYGVIVFLVMIGTIWIMGHMNANMMPSATMMNLQMQR